MYDFSRLTTNLEGSSLTNVIVIALAAFALSSIIAFTYQKTNKDLIPPKYFIQSLIMISIPVSMVMQAIGDSLARGLGMLGALAIIRFRTTLRNPRNITFMFASLAVGIACGVYGISIATVGVLVFCIVAFLIHFSKLSNKDNILATIRFQVPGKYNFESPLLEKIESIFKDQSTGFQLLSYNKSTRKRKKKKNRRSTTYDYEINIDHRDNGREIVDTISNLKNVREVKINFKEDEKY
ncbi:MAG: DUF4956 domain-containing protein [Nonlabens sp.]